MNNNNNKKIIILFVIMTISLLFLYKTLSNINNTTNSELFKEDTEVNTEVSTETITEVSTEVNDKIDKNTLEILNELGIDKDSVYISKNNQIVEYKTRFDDEYVDTVENIENNDKCTIISISTDNLYHYITFEIK